MPICIYCGHRIWPWQSRVHMAKITAHLACRLGTPVRRVLGRWPR